MQAYIVEQSYHCPTCGVCILGMLETKAPTVEVMELNERMYLEDVGNEHVYIKHDPVEKLMFKCKDCERIHADIPDVTPVWQCGSCEEKYYGSSAKEFAVQCCQ